MKILAIANQKGGVGKSTLTVHLAYAAIEAGLRVLLVDMDKQGIERYSTEIRADAVQPLGARPEGAGGGSRQPQGQGNEPQPVGALPPDMDDDLPY